MALTLSLKKIPEVPLEVEGVLPASFRQLDSNARARFPIHYGKEVHPLTDWFDITGNLEDETMVWSGDLSRVHWIGAGLNSGLIIIEGNVGRHLGSEMTDGAIRVSGDASDWVGAEMRGGTIQVDGSAGHLVGAAYRGSPVGMRGGTIFVHGNAGNEIGHSMCRGTIAVSGDVGDLAAFGMRAGTIVIGGKAGIRHGANMIRGTLIYITDAEVPLLPTFRHGAVQQATVLRLIARELSQAGFSMGHDWADREFRLYHGDFLAGGRGEVWLPIAA